jgi:hypothetical protein
MGYGTSPDPIGPLHTLTLALHTVHAPSVTKINGHEGAFGDTPELTVKESFIAQSGAQLISNTLLY